VVQGFIVSNAATPINHQKLIIELKNIFGYIVFKPLTGKYVTALNKFLVVYLQKFLQWTTIYSLTNFIPISCL
jgi:hypothetical protein